MQGAELPDPSEPPVGSAISGLAPPAAVSAIPVCPDPSLLDRALDILFPPVCVGCRLPGRWICAGCWLRVPWDMAWHCPNCFQLTTPAGCAFCAPGRNDVSVVGSVALFTDAAREAVHTLKYNERHAISSLLGGLMAQLASAGDYDLVLHVPLHPSRRRERGYDQSQLLAKAVAKTLHLPYVSGLRRVRKTQQQALLENRDARMRNVAGAFEATRAFHGETVPLVDDVSTTGATLRAAAGGLLDAGAGRVAGLVFARAI